MSYRTVNKKTGQITIHLSKIHFVKRVNARGHSLKCRLCRRAGPLSRLGICKNCYDEQSSGFRSFAKKHIKVEPVRSDEVRFKVEKI